MLQNIKLLLITLLLLHCLLSVNSIQERRSDREQQVAAVATTTRSENTNNHRIWGPKVLCSMLPDDFIECNKPIDHKNNQTAKDEKGHGCLKFGGLNYEDVEQTKVQCTVFSDIDCNGPRTFMKDAPCIKYTEHYFLTTLLYSLLLGFLGMDRFCLGQTGTAVGKLLSLGGVGVWWVVDLILLITNRLTPEDGSNWNPNV